MRHDAREERERREREYLERRVAELGECCADYAVNVDRQTPPDLVQELGVSGFVERQLPVDAHARLLDAVAKYLRAERVVRADLIVKRVPESPDPSAASPILVD